MTLRSERGATDPVALMVFDYLDRQIIVSLFPHLKAEWGLSEMNRKARIYKITPAGRKQLDSERGRWNQLSAAIAGLMNPAAS